MPDSIRTAALDSVPHGFFGREHDDDVGEGGGDTPFAAERDEVMPDAALALLRQTHSPQAILVQNTWDFAARPEGDALATARKGVLLGIVTADCAPVLLADSEAGIVGAAHAGWKGALHGVTDAAIVAMERLGANRARIKAAIGPCIAQANYEVGDDFGNAFLAADKRNARFFLQGKSGKPHFDLEGYVMSRLVQAGIATIEATQIDTYAGEGRFHSYRRATHRKKACSGRQVSLIGLPAA